MGGGEWMSSTILGWLRDSLLVFGDGHDEGEEKFGSGFNGDLYLAVSDKMKI